MPVLERLEPGVLRVEQLVADGKQVLGRHTAYVDTRAADGQALV